MIDYLRLQCVTCLITRVQGHFSKQLEALDPAKPRSLIILEQDGRNPLSFLRVGFVVYDSISLTTELIFMVGEHSQIEEQFKLSLKKQSHASRGAMLNL